MGYEQLTWDPAKYVEFGDFRNRPFFDLTGRITAASRPMRRATPWTWGAGPAT